MTQESVTWGLLSRAIFAYRFSCQLVARHPRKGSLTCKAERDRARDYRSCFKLVIRCNLRIALDRALERHISIGLSRSTIAKMMHFYWPSLEAFTAAHSRCVLERTKYKSNTFYPNLGTVGPLACSAGAVTGRGISSRHAA